MDGLLSSFGLRVTTTTFVCRWAAYRLQALSGQLAAIGRRLLGNFNSIVCFMALIRRRAPCAYDYTRYVSKRWVRVMKSNIPDKCF